MMNFFNADVDVDLTKDEDDKHTINVQSTSVAKKAATQNTTKPFQIFCDLDGVLVDFDAGVQRIPGNRNKSPNNMSAGQLWGSINRTPNFFEDLDWMVDGKTLWSSLVDAGYCPDILTGVPRTLRSRPEKFRWCQRELIYAFKDQNRTVRINHADYAGKKKAHACVSGVRLGGPKNEYCVVNVITCHSANKHRESGPGKVLIDDRIKLKAKWEAKGGIFIHHTDTASTIQKLVQEGILEAGDAHDDAVEENNGGRISDGDVCEIATKAGGSKSSGTSSEVVYID
jgi:hypothetical protein